MTHAVAVSEAATTWELAQQMPAWPAGRSEMDKYYDLCKAAQAADTEVALKEMPWDHQHSLNWGPPWTPIKVATHPETEIRNASAAWRAAAKSAPSEQDRHRCFARAAAWEALASCEYYECYRRNEVFDAARRSAAA